jgi:hypothetical protein
LEDGGWGRSKQVFKKAVVLFLGYILLDTDHTYTHTTKEVFKKRKIVYLLSYPPLER